MASFQAKIGCEMPRKRKNKNCLSVPFVLNGKFKIPEKVKKKKKMPLSLHFKPKQVGKCREIEKIKIVVPFRSHPRVIENSKKIAKNLKTLLWLLFKLKQVGKG